MLPLKIKCPNCDSRGNLNDRNKFATLDKHEGYSVTECRKCGLRLAYKVPVFKRYGAIVTGMLFMIWGGYASITAQSHGVNKLFSGIIMGSIFLLVGLNSMIKVKKTFRK